jgi:hypothetical protein
MFDGGEPMAIDNDDGVSLERAQLFLGESVQTTVQADVATIV